MHFPEGFGYRIWEEFAPPENDLGVLLPRAEMRLPRLSPWIATLCIVRNYLNTGRLPWEQCKEWHVPSERALVRFCVVSGLGRYDTARWP